MYAYGTNTGIRAVAAGEHRHAEDELRYVRRRYITVESCRQAAQAISSAVGVKNTCSTRAEVSRRNCGYAVRSIDVTRNPSPASRSQDAPHRNGQPGHPTPQFTKPQPNQRNPSQPRRCPRQPIAPNKGLFGLPQFKRYSGGKTLHQLRHSRLTHLGEANVSAPLLMAISGHKRLATLQRYVRPSQAAVAALMAASDPDRRGR